VCLIESFAPTATTLLTHPAAVRALGRTIFTAALFARPKNVGVRTALQLMIWTRRVLSLRRDSEPTA